MNKAAVAGGFVGVFVLGIAIGTYFGQQPQPNSNTTIVVKNNGNSGSGKPDSHDLSGGATNTGTNQQTTTKSGTKNDGKNTQPQDRPAIRKTESADKMLKPLNENQRQPMAPPPGALAEGERVKKELEEKGAGGGRVTALSYDFDTPEEAKAWEERRRNTWRRRLQREIDIKLKIMKEKVGISATQVTAMQRVLANENKERTRLVDLLTAKQISRTTFDESVRSNVEKARAEVKSILSDEQYAAYQKLDPREQVLRDEVK